MNLVDLRLTFCQCQNHWLTANAFVSRTAVTRANCICLKRTFNRIDCERKYSDFISIGLCIFRFLFGNSPPPINNQLIHVERNQFTPTPAPLQTVDAIHWNYDDICISFAASAVIQFFSQFVRHFGDCEKEKVSDRPHRKT